MALPAPKIYRFEGFLAFQPRPGRPLRGLYKRRAIFTKPLRAAGFLLQNGTVLKLKYHISPKLNLDLELLR